MKKALLRLTLHNFQSHEDTTLELKDGVNVIVGASDVGKTSVIRALRWVFYNQPRGTGFIRMGTSDCWVEVESEDRVVVRRYRNEATRKNGYWLIYPGQEPLVFEKYGSGVPDEVRRALGVEEMVIDQDVAFNLNIAYQLDGAFLLEEPGTTKAKAIGRLGDAHIVDAAQREIQRDLRALNQDIEYKKGQLASEEKSLANYNHLSDWEAQITGLKLIWDQHNQKSSLLGTLNQWQSKHQLGRQQKQTIAKILVDLSGIDASESILTTLQSRQKLDEQLTNLYQQQEYKVQESGIQKEILNKTSTLDKSYAVFDQIQTLLTRLHQFIELKQHLDNTREALHKTSNVITATDRLDDAITTFDSISQSRAVFNLIQQLYKDYSSKQIGLHDASRKLIATVHLEQGESIIQQLGSLREQGLTYNEIWRSYRQRNQQQDDIRRQISQLHNCDAAEVYLQTIKELAVQMGALTADAIKQERLLQELQQQQGQLESLAQTYQRGIDQYLSCLSDIGECPVCHGQLDDNHLQELKVQLLEEWGNDKTSNL